MTYTVSSGKLNPSIPYHTALFKYMTVTHIDYLTYTFLELKSPTTEYYNMNI